MDQRWGRRPHRVLFVAGIEGACLRYRVRHVEEALRLGDIRTLAVFYRDPHLDDLLAAADAVVLHRVPMTAQVFASLARFRTARPHVPLLFDVDDLIVDVDLVVDLHTLDRLPAQDRQWWLEGVRRYRATMLLCDAVTVSTPTIAASVAEAGLPAFVLPNGVGGVTAHDSARALRRDRRPGALRLGYFSGSPTHDEDWASVAPAVAEVLRGHPGARLQLVGPVDPGPHLAGLSHRLDRVPFTSWRRLPRLLRSVDVVLAPLVPGRFSDAKSAIKWLEAGLVGTPTVAAPAEGFRAAVVPGETGVLADGPDEWVAALVGLLDDGVLRAGLGAAALAEAHERYGPRARRATFLAALGEVEPRGAAAVDLDVPAEARRHDEPPLPKLLEPYPFPGQTGPVYRAGLFAERSGRAVATWAALTRRDLADGGAPAVAAGAGRVAKRGWDRARAAVPRR